MKKPNYLTISQTILSILKDTGKGTSVPFLLINNSMFGIGKVGMSQCGPGGVVLGPGAPTVFAEGMPVSVGNDNVTPHGENMHAKPTVLLPTCSKTVLAMGKPVAMQTQSTATCGHPMTIGAVTVKVGI